MSEARYPHNTQLRVALDAHMVGEQETGNETYVLNLICGLAATDTETPYVLYSPHPDALRVCGQLPANFTICRVRPAQDALRIAFGMPARVAHDRMDVLHVTYVAPPIVSSAVVATVHDVSYLVYPQAFSRRDRLILGTQVPRTLRRAEAVITVSQHARREICGRYGTPEDKVHVVYQAISPVFRRLDEPSSERIRAQYRIGGPYVLAVGNLQPRKNLPRLIRAYAKLRRAGIYSGQLALVGKSAWRESDIYNEMRRLGLEQQIVLTGYVNEDDLVALYAGADLFVYPSLYEGFGLPPLEAMACGCPVVASNTSSLPEVVGDAALTADPTSDETLAAAMARLIHDTELRRNLVYRGLAHAKRFSREAFAGEVRAIYDRAAEIYFRRTQRSAPLTARVRS
jgi:glycosyltransferase involved in cell wall biosynthesis